MSVVEICMINWPMPTSKKQILLLDWLHGTAVQFKIQHHQLLPEVELVEFPAYLLSYVYQEYHIVWKGFIAP